LKVDIPHTKEEFIDNKWIGVDCQEWMFISSNILENRFPYRAIAKKTGYAILMDSCAGRGDNMRDMKSAAFTIISYIPSLYDGLEI
jgi:hypothetical protein